MKLFRDIIFILTVVLLTFVGKTIKAATYFSFQQTTQQTDATKKSDPNELNDKIQYAADDSTIVDKKRKTVHLYGNAKVIKGDYELQAAYIRYNTETNVVFARGIYNKNGKYIGRPIFKMGAEGTGSADSLTFNLDTKEGTIDAIYTAQQGGYFSGGIAKKQPDDEVHVRGQVFSTCNLPHPHYGFKLTRAILTENKIITGPMYLIIEDTPIPLGLPFSLLPKPNKKSSGFILPTPNQDATRGFSLNGGGYYQAFNDHIDGRLIGNVYTNGSYDLSFSSRYLTRYKYDGGVNLSFSSVRNGLEGTPEYKPQTAFNISWNHSQNANARPGTTFSASVNAGTSNFYQVNQAVGSYDINAIAQNTLNSSISYGKVFANGLFNFTGAFRSNQETQNKTISLSLPEVSLNMGTLNPFGSKTGGSNQQWYQKITMGYSMQAANTINTREDLLFDKGGLKRFRNGVAHNIPISMAFNLLKYFNFNANTNYNEKWYFQTVNQRRFKDTDSIARDTVNGFKRAGEYSIGMGMTTKIYGEMAFKNFLNWKKLRHVMTPSFSLSYKPDFSAAKYGYYKTAYYYNNDIRPGRSTRIDDTPVIDPYTKRELKYSIFEGAQYGGPSAGEQANLSFSLDNSVELKIKSKKDTTNGGEKKIPIIQGLNISGSYNFMAPEKKLSQLGFGGRSQFTDKLGFNFSGSFSPYLVDKLITPSAGLIPASITLFESNRYVFSEAKLPRLTNFNFSFDYSFNPEAVKRKNKNMDELNTQMGTQAKTPEQLAELEAISRDPNAFVDFNIPWNFSFSYSFSYFNALGDKATRQVSNTLNFNGDFALTPKIKVQFNSGWDFKAKNISYTSFAIYRDLHCWALNANWIPFGAYQSYSITIQVKEAILQDLKLSKRKGYYTKY
ncbi:putative LPS assembly protein LptD [Pedobacter sp. Du54]|uniref:putative LPS assembly protein LptD n=1 Tax=Pedobacter anseongensis TaxID=3133439 RepID=UPI00309F19BE